jgi:hypothetical protein
MLNSGRGRTNMLTGLLLGAGASYECGMPTAWELTHAMQAIATPEMLRGKNSRSHAANLGFPDHLVEELITLLSIEDMHYESVIGNLEVKYRRHGGHGDGQHYYGLKQDLTELVYFILLDRHQKQARLLPAYMRFLDGIVGLANVNRPLWIFSLNHDLLIECVAASYGVPLNSGFSAKTSFPLPATEGQIDHLDAELLTSDEVRKAGLRFFYGEPGINLFKLHGSLDIFSVRDEADHIKLLPTSPNAEGVLTSVVLANSRLHHKLPHAPFIRATNEIM